MSIGGKIRFLLLLLGICCVVTALSLNNSITQNDLLAHEASELQTNLNAKELFVQKLLADPIKVEELKRFHKDPNLSLNFINDNRENGINVLIYKNNELQFWSTIKVWAKNVERIKEGTTFTQQSNGYYEVIKKTSNDYTFLFLITVKTQYSIENQYLENRIVPELFANNSLQIANFTDRNIKEIFNLKKEYLFPVKLSDEYSRNIYSTMQLWLWIIGLACVFLFVNSYCSSLVKKGYLLTATIVITTFFILLRLSDLKYFWFNHQFNLDLFSPSIYAESDLLPSLGDLLLNVLSISWILVFIYIHRFEYKFPKKLTESRVFAFAMNITFLLILSYVAFMVEDIFFGLIYNSKINFDITDIINLTWISWVCIFILCLVWFNIYLLVDIFLELDKKLNLNNRERAIIFVGLLAGYFIFRLAITNFNVYFLVYALLLFTMAYSNYRQAKKFSIGVFAILFLCMAFLTSLKYIKFNDIKERDVRATIAEKLLYNDDPKVINAIDIFENGIYADSVIIRYFKQPQLTQITQTFSFHNYITKKYLDGYLSRFEYKMYEYNTEDSPLKFGGYTPISKYKELVRSGAVKTQETNHFYRINDTFGFQSYFGMIPIFEGKKFLGTFVIELKSQPHDYNSHFPDLLIDGKLKSDEDFSNYSFAFYRNHTLINQSGNYTYPMVNKGVFKGDASTVNFVSDKVDFNIPEGADHSPYNHAIFQPEPSKLIVISKEKVSNIQRLATLSFFFLVFIVFGILLNGLLWLIRNADTNRGGWFSINRYLMINANKILYKTRIQLTVVLSVVATLLIVGWTTFFNIRAEYMRQQEDLIREKIRKIQLSYEKQILNLGFISNDEESKYEFNQFADVNAVFLNLYDTNGNLYLTSLDKMYEYGIIARKMGAKAFIYLSTQQRSEFLNPTEKIGTFKYAAAYAPIRNAQNQTIAYIGMPYYANEADYQAKIGLFINTLINIYALVFVLIGILAIFLANQITNPLNFIQATISKTKLGQKNEPIIWHRQDEIGTLIKEYNKMIAALELSATKLAKSERESAWREMAKQVAHEIKNPLTPLKLGVQLLEKSWKENDPNFERKFALFNKSFIEQIDSLANIASEFSTFAKMPDTKLEQLQLVPIIMKAIEVFNTAENVEILVLNRTNRDIVILGDKDQLLRTFNNLLKNAIEATDEKGRCAIRIHIANDNKHVFVDVEDNGKGIEAMLQDKIFGPNFTTKSSGTGLGLAFVKQATENAGGKIEFKSEENVGTTFYLTFPLS